MKKKQIKALKKLSEMLPNTVVFEIESTKTIANVYELTQKEIDDLKVENLNQQFIRTQKQKKIVEVNHFNRLKTAYANGKEKGLSDYINWVDANNKYMNKIFEQLKLEGVSDELKEIASKSGSRFWDSLINFIFAFYNIFITKKVA
jgi:hypothetical protein